VKTVEYSSRSALGFYTFSTGKGAIAKESGDFYLHLEKPYRFLFGSRRELERLEVRFGSDKGEYDLEIRQFDLPFWRGKTSREVKTVDFEPAAAYRFKRLFLYEIGLRLKHHSDESMLLEPFLFQVIPRGD
jgi:hypothetical protein